MNVIVVGIGFMGSGLVRRLSRQGFDVTQNCGAVFCGKLNECGDERFLGFGKMKFF